MKESYDKVYVVGKFRVLHIKHQELLEKASEYGELTCLLGSTNILPKEVAKTRRQVFSHLGLSYKEIVDFDCSDEEWAESFAGYIKGLNLYHKTNILIVYADDGTNGWHELLRNHGLDVLKMPREGQLSSTYILNHYEPRKCFISKELYKFYDRMVLNL